MRIVSWNINSLLLRLPLLKKLTVDLLPDFILLQETKVQDRYFPTEEIKELGFSYCYFAGEKSYNGVAVLSKVKCCAVEDVNFCINSQKRHISLRVNTEIGVINLHNLYIPAGGDIPDPNINQKFFHKIDFLDKIIDFFHQQAKKDEFTIIAGDFNIAPMEADVWSHKALINTVSHTEIEISKLNHLKKQGSFIDSHRQIHGLENKLYSWWSYRSPQHTINNRGRRLDHIWITQNISQYLLNAEFFADYRSLARPSDHVPISIDLSIKTAQSVNC